LRFSGPECPKIDEGWGFTPGPTWEAYSASPDPTATLRGREAFPRERDGERRGKGRGRGEGEGARDGEPAPWAQGDRHPSSISVLLTTCSI